MRAFANKLELAKAYERDFGLVPGTGVAKYTYQPHIYRGGFVIPGYGFSVERHTGKPSDWVAGNPYAVGVSA